MHWDFLLGANGEIDGVLLFSIFGKALEYDALLMAQEEDEYSFYQWLHLDLHIMIIVQDDHRRRWQRGDWTDDTDMMLCILDSFVACQKVDILDIARRFKEWMMNGGMGIGRHTYNVMALGDYTSNPQKAAEIIWKMGKKKAAANGAVMSTSVVGLVKDNVANAAVAGAILGTKFGIDPIPEEWRNGLLYASMLHNKVQEFYAMYQ